jgi:hypothetical protein
LIPEIFTPFLSAVREVLPRWSLRKYSASMLCGGSVLSHGDAGRSGEVIFGNGLSTARVGHTLP